MTVINDEPTATPSNEWLNQWHDFAHGDMLIGEHFVTVSHHPMLHVDRAVETNHRENRVKTSYYVDVHRGWTGQLPNYIDPFYILPSFTKGEHYAGPLNQEQFDVWLEQGRV